MDADDPKRGARISNESVEASLAELDRVVAKMKSTSAKSVETSERFARDARAARPSQSNPNMRAVRTPVPYVPVAAAASMRRTSTAEELAAIDPADLTSRFNLLKRGL